MTGKHKNPDRAEAQLLQQARGQFLGPFGEQRNPRHTRVGARQEF